MKKQRVSLRRRVYSASLRTLMLLCTGITAALVIFAVIYIPYKGIPNITWELLSSSPSILRGTVGILPDILNTVYIIIASVAVVLPLGVGAAIYLNEYAPGGRIVVLIEYAAETLSGIPSIIYGLVGMLFFCRFMGLKTSLLAGALTLTIMNLPTVMRSAQESLRTVPQSYREGAYALGAGKWRMIRTVVIPSCAEGIITGCILSVGRIIGESAALLFTAGFAHTLVSPFKAMLSSGSTLTVALYFYAKEDGEFGVAFAIATVLLLLTAAIELLAAGVQKHFERKKK